MFPTHIALDVSRYRAHASRVSPIESAIALKKLKGRTIMSKRKSD
jgi:hypothetical protein